MTHLKFLKALYIYENQKKLSLEFFEFFHYMQDFILKICESYKDQTKNMLIGHKNL